MMAVSQLISTRVNRNASFPSGDLSLMVFSALSEETKQLTIRMDAEATNTSESIVIGGHHTPQETESKASTFFGSQR
jgi:hypothetical protein